MEKKKVRVLVVDDMAVSRNFIARGLTQDAGIEVVATASDPYYARDMIAQHLPDVITLDLEMPRMNGLEFLKKLMPCYPLPVVVVSSFTSEPEEMIAAIRQAGAVDYVIKPGEASPGAAGAMLMELRTKVKLASTVDVSHFKVNREPVRNGVPADHVKELIIAIGASTGGTEAIKEVVTRFPAGMPGVVMVQHMPPGFTRMFADRLNGLCRMEVREAEDGDEIVPGRILLAPGGFQLKVYRAGNSCHVRVFSGELVNGHCPSVSVMMSSVAE
ncbi:MAG: chemotaxis protein CheB, partial [Victivallales bacterium]|nr:chemotaxis protein CheB [Victivallales bacterium]